MPLLLSGLRLVLRKVMEQHREHVHTVQYGVKVGFYPRDTRLKGRVPVRFSFTAFRRCYFKDHPGGVIVNC